jgi:hypothetical protein
MFSINTEIIDMAINIAWFGFTAITQPFPLSTYLQ